MLYCGLSEITEQMVVAASVFHPRRPEVELLSPGVTLDSGLIQRLRQLGVPAVWVEHDLTRDLDQLIDAMPSRALLTAFQQLRHDFGEMGRQSISAGHVQAYRQIVMDLVCELIGNRNLSGLTERLIGGPRSLFTHSANVAYLSVSVALDLEAYVIRQRRQMAMEHARDLTSLGIGAMLHDIGKAALLPEQRDRHEVQRRGVAAPADDEDALAQYRNHPVEGFQMLRDTRAPASARQVVLSHHQRWDGQGFPDMKQATDARREGTLQGEGIHIFSRIVAAANVLDNLLSDTRIGMATSPDQPGTLPVVAALHRFASSEFDGWFDPVVRDSMLRRVPPFAVGSRVVLSDGRAAVVVTPSMEQPCRPSVRLLEGSEAGDQARADEATKAPALDLRLHRDLHIARCGGVDVQRYLFSMAERSPLALEAVFGRVA